MFGLENKSEKSRAFQSNPEKQSPTAQFKDNRNAELKHEAVVMGEKTMQCKMDMIGKKEGRRELGSAPNIIVQRQKSKHGVLDSATGTMVDFSMESDRLPPSLYVMKMISAFTGAINLLRRIIGLLENYHGLNVDELFDLRFRQCFGEISLPMVSSVIRVYRKTLDGLVSNKPNFTDFTQSEKGNPKMSQTKGYVSAFRIGSIHLDFGMEYNGLVRFIIHEATHLYAKTVDVKYLDEANVNIWMDPVVNPDPVRRAEPFVLRDLKRGTSVLYNADSYAAFAMLNSN
ncbi:MAG: hypothetical protein IK005_12045 [Paludibacteraceae bacterium]|nr:hypothetical protein [Paludibacteraceae bacterium]